MATATSEQNELNDTTDTTDTNGSGGNEIGAAPRRWPKVVAVVALVVVAVAAILVRDVARVDPTSGGYEAPYDDVRGEPIDWFSQQVTDTGFRDDGGILLNASLDCTTGMIRIHVGPFTFDYRTLSQRAIVVHRPADACREAGFDPAWDTPLESSPSRG